jgi:hypothetical protein
VGQETAASVKLNIDFRHRVIISQFRIFVVENLTHCIKFTHD